MTDDNDFKLNSRQTLEHARGDDDIEDLEYLILRSDCHLDVVTAHVKEAYRLVKQEVEQEYLRKKAAGEDISDISNETKREDKIKERMMNDPEVAREVQEKDDLEIGIKMMKIRLGAIKRNYETNVEAFRYINRLRAEKSLKIDENGKVIKSADAFPNTEIISGGPEEVIAKLQSVMDKIRATAEGGEPEQEKTQPAKGKGKVETVGDVQYT